MFKVTPNFIIVGSHRSGTSALSTFLKENRVFLGGDLNVHEESKLFLSLNEEIMLKEGATWDNPKPIVAGLQSNDRVKELSKYAEEILKERIKSEFLSNRSLLIKLGIQKYHSIGWKDPRNSLTLPVWLHLFPNLKVVHIHRNGFEVAMSLVGREKKRNKKNYLYSERCIQFESAFALWAEYETAIQSYKVRVNPSSFFQISYDQLVAPDNEAILNSLLRFITARSFVYKDTTPLRRKNDSKELNRVKTEYSWLKREFPIYETLGYE